jgi:hypothetical protein
MTLPCARVSAARHLALARVFPEVTEAETM